MDKNKSKAHNEKHKGTILAIKVHTKQNLVSNSFHYI